MHARGVCCGLQADFHSRRATKKAAAFAGTNSAIAVVGSDEVVPGGGFLGSCAETPIDFYMAIAFRNGE